MQLATFRGYRDEKEEEEYSGTNDKQAPCKEPPPTERLMKFYSSLSKPPPLQSDEYLSPRAAPFSTLA